MTDTIESPQPAAQPAAQPVALPTAVALFERQAALTPAAVALRRGAERCTYGELADRVDRCSRGLPAVGVRTGDVVAVGGGRSIDTVVAVLAVLRAGAVVLPLDAAQPLARAAELVAESGARLMVVTSSVFADVFADCSLTWP